MGPVEWRDVGHDADKAARAKEKSYEKALAREAEGGDGWLKHVRGQEVDRFIPIAYMYEMCGTWGAPAGRAPVLGHRRRRRRNAAAPSFQPGSPAYSNSTSNSTFVVRG